MSHRFVVRQGFPGFAAAAGGGCSAHRAHSPGPLEGVGVAAGDSLADRVSSLSDGDHDDAFPALPDIPLPHWLRFTTTTRATTFAPTTPAPSVNDAQDPGPLIALSPSVPSTSIDCSPSPSCAVDKSLPPTVPETLDTSDKYIPPPPAPTSLHRSPPMMPC